MWSSLQSRASFGLPDAAIPLLFFLVKKFQVFIQQDVAI
jgi:hypothetical protein